MAHGKARHAGKTRGPGAEHELVLDDHGRQPGRARTVDVTLRCITGMRADSDALRFDPMLPPQVKRLSFSVHFRGHRLAVLLTEHHLKVSSRRGDPSPIRVAVGEQLREVCPGTRAEFRLGGEADAGDAP